MDRTPTFSEFTEIKDIIDLGGKKEKNQNFQDVLLIKKGFRDVQNSTKYHG